MKINSSTPPTVKPPSVRPQAATNSTATAKTSGASTAPHLQQTGALDTATAPFDSQRVAEIRQAIAEGRFQIDADKIATGLIDSVRDLLANDRPSA
ncbi:MAG: flagellar biosynthesis anti-sigma factor FlgM [Burkholderiaceae bacterium]|nr:flagellar biosynthesis anti-sigma factor FlgM [Sulfuritalea sp.]MCF8174141.1 flagellar biosynthesis anti-sigma factor FlgM [Burkholderiaceae bacterium]MCF8184613.1 flagellar biosynthesis anti-sigma factor FlgM [Polynucleobacter sp.]